ncbi:hypothetical protein SHIRM173S_10844 [Streptomyces hirsutus]
MARKVVSDRCLPSQAGSSVQVSQASVLRGVGVLVGQELPCGVQVPSRTCSWIVWASGVTSVMRTIHSSA